MLHIHIPRPSAKKLLKEHGLARSYPYPFGRVPDSSCQVFRSLSHLGKARGREWARALSSALS